MGPDGHTASLFPNHSALKVDQGLVTYLQDSPKPPPERLTLTLNTINQAKHKIVVATGQSKADIIKDVLHDKSQKYPIGLVNDLIWYLDSPAASKL
jgi:6-phosphogluconolactonase